MRDRTGPDGFGPRTGRSLGYCGGYSTPGYTESPGMGRGFGRGRGWGRRGSWRRAPAYNLSIYGAPGVPIAQISPENQLSILKREKDYLTSEMDGIKDAIENISKSIQQLEQKKTEK